MNDEKKQTWRVVETIPESHDTTTLVIEPEEGSAPLHKPGQFASIRVLRDDGWSEPHPFTISCAAGTGRFQFTIKRAGKFTNDIPLLQPGTPVQCSLPLGAFCKDIVAKENIVMIAGGVGITPFLSVLRTFREQGARNRITLLWANKTLDDAFDRDELAELASTLDLRVVHVLSRQSDLPKDAADGRISYVAGRIDRELLLRHAVSPTASFYLCGPPAMQDAILAALEACGVDPGQVQKEAFSFKK